MSKSKLVPLKYVSYHRMQSEVSFVILDGTAIIYANIPKSSKSFGEFIMSEVTPMVQPNNTTPARTDIVCYMH